MIKLNLTIDDQKKSFNIPTSWADVSIGQYENLSKLDKEKGKENELQFAVDVLCSISDMTKDDAFMLPITETEKVFNNIDFVKKPIPESKKRFVEVDGIKYYFKDDYDKLTNGEVISLELLTKKYEGNIDAGMSEILCVFLRQKKENGKIEGFKSEFMERAEIFRDKISVADVYQLIVFFSNGKSELSKTIKGFLVAQ